MYTVMNDADKILAQDSDGMVSYEYLVNHCDAPCEHLSVAVESIGRLDTTGQFAASAARFLSALGRDDFAPLIDTLLKQAIDKDREKAYLPSLLSSIWGEDYALHADTLRETDDNFRRIYKRVHPSSAI